MTVKEIRNLLWSNPHRLNDLHVEYLLKLIDDWQESYDDLETQHNKLRSEFRQHSQAMAGNMLSLLLNKPELFAKE